MNDEDYVLYLNKSKLLPISLTVFKNDLLLLNKILNNELPINFLIFGQSTRALSHSEHFSECQ